MNLKRRQFLQTTFGAGLMAAFPRLGFASKSQPENDIYAKLDEAANRPVLKRELFKSPVIIESIDLMNYEDSYLCRVRSTDGAEGWCICNNIRMYFLYPILNLRIKPIFMKRDARDLEALVQEAYLSHSNYKFQSYALWIPVATIELAILDMLGQIAGKSMGELVGQIYNPKVAHYLTPGMRDESAETTVEWIEAEVKKTGIKAAKFKIGKKMGYNAEDIPGRTEKLIPMARKVLGDDVWLGVDANGGYLTQKAIEIGNLMAENDYDFYEEPLPFDWYTDLKTVADAVDVPIAGGEQEASMRNFRWMIANDVLQIVRPDVFYFGGMIRSMKVARMAEAAGKTIVPHSSGSGVGFLYVAHFVSAIPNAGPYQPNSRPETPIPLTCSTSSLQVENGKLTVPTGPGLGVEIDPGFIKKHRIVESESNKLRR